MAEESANALVQFGADNVLKFAGLGLRLGVVDSESVLEEALGEAMAADDIAGASAAAGGELNVAVVHFYQTQFRHAPKNLGGWIIRD